jgi:hypothetical protein
MTEMARQPQPLTCYFINARSLAKDNASQQLLTDFTSYSIVIGAVVETHLMKSHDGHFSTVDGYHTYRCDRDGRKVDGVCAFVSEHFDSELITTSNIEEGFQNIMK